MVSKKILFSLFFAFSSLVAQEPQDVQEAVITQESAPYTLQQENLYEKTDLAGEIAAKPAKQTAQKEVLSLENNRIALSILDSCASLLLAYFIAQNPVIKESIRNTFTPKNLCLNILQTTTHNALTTLVHEGGHALGLKLATGSNSSIHIGNLQAISQALYGNTEDLSLFKLGNLSVEGFCPTVGLCMPNAPIDIQSPEMAKFALAGPVSGILINFLAKIALQKNNALNLDRAYLVNLMQLIPWKLNGNVYSDGYLALNATHPDLLNDIPEELLVATGHLTQFLPAILDFYKQRVALGDQDLSLRDLLALFCIAIANAENPYFKAKMAL